MDVLTHEIALGCMWIVAVYLAMKFVDGSTLR